MKPSQIPFLIVKAVNKGFDALWWIWSQAVNSWLWVTKYRGALYGACFMLAQIKERTKTLDDVRRELKAFHWTEDKFIDWFPWVRTLAASGLRDDCDGASVYGKFLLDCIGIPSRRVKLIATCDTWAFWRWYGHIIQVSNDNKYFISNNDLVEIILNRVDSEHFEQDMIIDDWKSFVILYFAEGGDKYDWIF